MRVEHATAIAVLGTEESALLDVAVRALEDFDGEKLTSPSKEALQDRLKLSPLTVV